MTNEWNPDTLPVHVDHDGIERKLGYVPPADIDAHMLMREAAPSIQTIPMSEWKPVDYTGLYLPSAYADRHDDLIVDQLQEGACVGFSDVGAWMRQHYIRTGEVIVLSGWDAYDQVNGGQDRGANIIQMQQVMLSRGVTTLDKYPKSRFFANYTPPGAIYYTEDVNIKITGSLDAGSALMTGKLPQMPLNANIFNSFDSNNVATGPIGSGSNHSIYLAGMIEIGGVWVFIMVNSWNVKWRKRGTCLIPLAAIDRPAVTNDAWCHANSICPTDSPPGAP